MLYQTCACNLCRCQVQQNETGLIDGVSLMPCGDAGIETEQFRLSTEAIGNIHVCIRCWKGLQRAMLSLPANDESHHV